MLIILEYIPITNHDLAMGNKFLVKETNKSVQFGSYTTEYVSGTIHSGHAILMDLSNSYNGCAYHIKGFD